jgi:nucleotide-binding universal stress UspA family protein
MKIPEIRNILCPVDFSDSSRLALDYAVHLAGMTNAVVGVMHAFMYPDYVGVFGLAQLPEGLSALEEAGRAEAARKLDEFLAAAALLPEISIHRRIHLGPPAEEIVAAAMDYQLIVMGTHGRSGLPHLLLGSVAEKVVRHAPCPVLTVRAPKPAKPG